MKNLPEISLELSLEQQFRVSQLRLDMSKLTAEQSQEIITDLLTKIFIQQNVINKLVEELISSD
jgi:hypothetical protein